MRKTYNKNMVTRDPHGLANIKTEAVESAWDKMTDEERAELMPVLSVFKSLRLMGSESAVELAGKLGLFLVSDIWHNGREYQVKRITKDGKILPLEGKNTRPAPNV